MGSAGRPGWTGPSEPARGENPQLADVSSFRTQVARQSGVPIVHDVSLARALHELDHGDAIPEALYEAVAELLRALHAEVGNADQ